MKIPPSTQKPSRLTRRLAVTLGATLVAAAMGGAQAATAQDPDKDTRTQAIKQDGPVPGGFASWQELLATQERLVSAADRVAATAQAQGANGYAGIVVAPENREVRVYWKGNAPQAVATLASELRDEANVRVMPARHSARQLANEAARITRRAGGAITSVAPHPDGTGLTVTGPNASAVRSAARAAAVDSTVPITVEVGVTPKLMTRWNDSAPWWGGAAWRNASSGGGCSTGFAVWHGGVTKMLSAGHCGSVGNTATDPTGEVMGPISQDNDGRDVLLINARSGGRVFNNAIGNTSAEFSNPVIGTSGSYVGMWVCTSGAYSGTNCNVQVKQTGVSIWVGYWITGTVRAEQVAHTNAVGQGDSGGPVEVVNSANTTQVYAAGVNSAIDTSTAVPCTGYVTSGRTCAWRMYYAPWSNAVAAFPGISIVLG
ncbi:hypothetical protein FHS43_001599 [Streptosporangium becharense]|uniref:Streptogrisin C n=1 Tax=Streptosporangium becharense TaxID=1816182 RepID=A0A7W9MK32_9ACTN|nr:hypothetical protein [Streptosporangium becharense]MBB2910336.1 hypothetical protein [Streptosporangium becharense]MBB5823079.1 hypothetical protein [Streptosporangium becharense]